MKEPRDIVIEDFSGFNGYATNPRLYTKEECRYAMENAIRAAGPLDHEPYEAYFNRVKRYASEILIKLKELQNE
jgi:hypothetical protein|tara:strand:- start:846 stop:1067 length:222 start_codon:yes stop_codon:yes gene_type:complete